MDAATSITPEDVKGGEGRARSRLSRLAEAIAGAAALVTLGLTIATIVRMRDQTLLSPAGVAFALFATLVPAMLLLVLIGRRQLRSNNSWMHNVPRLMRGPERCTLYMHPADAAGLAEGAEVEVATETGAVRVPLELTDTLMPGVVSLPHGFGHGLVGVGQRVAAARPGVSLNDLTDPARVDALTGNAVLNGTPVTVRAVSGAAD